MSTTSSTHQPARGQDLTGQQFGRLTVSALAERRSGRAYWRCACECGRSIIAEASNLKRGQTRSCGCVRVEATRKAKTTHGHTTGRSRTPEYATWVGIIRRCGDADNPDYGGRGITVCDRWRDSFAAFFADMGPRPTSKHSIDRINNDGNYEPGNCRWAAPKEQQRNKRTTRFVEYNGQRRPLPEWSELLGVGESALRMRLKRRGTIAPSN